MNKLELINQLATRGNLSKKQAEDALNNLTDIITKALQKNEVVTITGFGAFSAKFRSARKGVNPQKPNESMDIPAVTVPKFKAGKALKDALKNINNQS